MRYTAPKLVKFSKYYFQKSITLKIQERKKEDNSIWRNRSTLLSGLKKNKCISLDWRQKLYGRVGAQNPKFIWQNLFSFLSTERLPLFWASNYQKTDLNSALKFECVSQITNCLHEAKMWDIFGPFGQNSVQARNVGPSSSSAYYFSTVRN